MKREIGFVLIVGLLAITMGMSAFAGDAEAVFNENETAGIKFRDIDWYSPYSSVEQSLLNSGISKSWFMYENEDDTVKGIDSDDPSNDFFFGKEDLEAENGGFWFWFDDVPVSNYNADLYIYSMYDISNGMIDKDRNNSLFYKAKYTIKDIADFNGAYDDLINKLSGLYGSPENKGKSSLYDSYDNALPTYVWYGSDGSQVILSLDYNMYDESLSEINIIYAAPNINGRVKELKDVLQANAVAEEGQIREENATNTSGL